MKLGQKIAINYLRAKLNLVAALSYKKAAAMAYKIFCTPYYRNRKTPPPFFDHAEKLSLKVSDVTVRGYRWNKGGVKRALLLHGFESSIKNFDRYVQLLVRKNYEVIAFDAPAHGGSDGKHITLPLYIATIRTIYFELGTMQAFMAHSFGGLALVHFLEKIPHDETMKLALIAPATESKTAIDTFFRFLQLSKKVRIAFDALLQKIGGVEAEYFSIPRAMMNIQATTLWVHDADDEVTPLHDVQQLMDKQLPNVHFLITHGFGHSRIYREEKVVKAVTDFL